MTRLDILVILPLCNFWSTTCCAAATPRSQLANVQSNSTFYRSVLNIASQLSDEPDRSRLDGCCAPSATGSITVLYVNDQKELIYEEIPGVSVEACECV